MHKNFACSAWTLLACVLIPTLGGCGGGASSAANPGTSSSASGGGTTLYTVGGTVSGLSSGQSVTLLNNGGDALDVTTDGTFAFSTGLAAGSAYEVAVQSQTTGITCLATNERGTIGSSNVTNVTVSCAPTAYTVFAEVAGLNSGQSVTLLNNGTDALTATSNGGVRFSNSETSGSRYDVTVQSQTAGITCTVANGSGTIGLTNVTAYVTCNARTETVLHTFSGADGKDPVGRLIMDGAGDLYGVTAYGGANDDGVVFELDAAGTETVLHSFSGPDGKSPAGGLVMDVAGNLYGTTEYGGASGLGTVFKVSPNGTETVLHSFSGGTTDGDGPEGSPIMDSAGNLYGTTSGGGVNGLGTVFEVSAAGTETVVHSFGAGLDGQGPAGSLLMDSSGHLYGTTILGGADSDGTVFETSVTGTESVLYSFSGAPDAQSPSSGLIMDSAGDLYGTTSGGGANSDGTVFEVTPGGTESVLFSFGPALGSQSSYGGRPGAGLVMDSAGNLYGTAVLDGAYGYGSVFEVSPSGTESVLYSFGTMTGGQDPNAGHPAAGLLMDGGGSLYGTTPYGGVNNDGTVFKIN